MSAKERPAEATYPIFPECLPEIPLDLGGHYSIRFARSTVDLDAVQRLRFEVFNLELGEGLVESYATGRDADRYDSVCHHLLVVDNRTEQVIGTYRMQTNEMAQRFLGFYSADEFDFKAIPPAILADAVEVGRACVGRAYRNRQVLFLLWRGLAAYMQWNRKRYLFGCCSLTSQDPAEGQRVMDYLRRAGHVRPDLDVAPMPDWVCYPPGSPAPAAEATAADIPKLFAIYLRFGAKVCGEPALDRFFKTIDYLVLLDIQDLGAEARAMFFR